MATRRTFRIPMKKIFIFWLVGFGLLPVLWGQSPERIQVMTYNILNYRNFTSYCPSAQNNPTTKEGYLREVMAYALPDLIVFNEVGGATATPHAQLLTNVLNVNGETRWAATPYANNGFSSLVNAIFYDQNKLGLVGHWTISKSLSNVDLVRVIDVVRFYYRDSLLSINPDTSFMTVVGAHLKAGNTTADAADRATATAAVMQFIAQRFPQDNVLLAGDLNVYKSQEVAFQNLINYSVSAARLYDPVGQLGAWNNNISFAPWHTQSTRNASTNNGCYSGGGLDDRFDHLLVSDEILNGTKKVHYVAGSFQTIGNDGNHFNSAVDEGSNNTIPSNIRTALYNISDHYPVILSLDMTRLGIGLPEWSKDSSWKIQTRGQGQFIVSCFAGGTTFDVVDLQGRRILEGSAKEGKAEFQLREPYSSLFVRMFDSAGRWISSNRLTP